MERKVPGKVVLPVKNDRQKRAPRDIDFAATGPEPFHLTPANERKAQTRSTTPSPAANDGRPRPKTKTDKTPAARATALYAAADAFEDGWNRVDLAIDQLANAVRKAHGADVIRAAIDDGAKVLAQHIDGAAGRDMDAAAIRWRRRMRGLVNVDGTSLNLANFHALKGDVASEQTRRAAYKEGGIFISGDGARGYVVKNRKGEKLLGLPRFAGGYILERPNQFAAQLQLLQSAHNGADAETLLSRANTVFSAVHERDHKATDQRLIYKPTEARAQAFVSAVLALRDAKTEAERLEKRAILQATLFAEAAPANRLMSFGLDMSPLGRINALDDLGEDFSSAVKAFQEGRIRDGAADGMWTVLDAMAAVGGIRFGKILEEVARTTPPGRRLSAAYKIARMEKAGPTPYKPVNAEAMLGSRAWAKYDDETKGYLRGLLVAAKGAAGEETTRQHLVDLRANGRRGVRIDEGKARESTEIIVNEEHRNNLKPTDKGRRHYDEILDGTGLKRVFGIFMLPYSTKNKNTFVEIKSDAAKLRNNQRNVDAIIKSNKKAYEANDVITLRIPYDDISKAKIREIAKEWMNAKDGVGRRNVYGRDKYKMINGEKVRTGRIKWSEAHLNSLMDDVDRAMKRQKMYESAPTVGDFLVGLSARMAVASNHLASPRTGED